VLRTPSVDIPKTQEASDAPADSAPGGAETPISDRQSDQAKDNDTPSTTIVTRNTEYVVPGQPAANTAPLLGRDVDYKLLISTTGRPAVLNLNNGEVQYSEGSRVHPLAVSGGWLVVETTTASGTASLPLDDLGADPVTLLDKQDILFTNIPPPLGPTIPGQLWVIAYRRAEENRDEIRPSLHLVDLPSGAIIDHPLAGEIPLTANRLSDRFADENGGLITSQSGGVYAVTVDGYQQVTEGRLVTATATRALIETCDSTLTCRQVWLDRNTWQPLDLSAPSDLQPLVIAVPGTDWVFTSRLSNTGPASLFNIRTDQTVDLRRSEFATSLVLPAVSPDGIWLAEPEEDSQTLTLRNLTTGDTTLVTLDDSIEGPMFFIEE